MAESDADRDKRELRELEGKNIAFYSTLLSAWIQTKMERDKTLITLSSAAIALLVTILTTVGISQSHTLILYIAAFIGFGLCIGTSLKIYQLNSLHLEKELRSENNDIKLEKYDKLSYQSFLYGVLFLCSIGIYSAYQTFTLTEKTKMESKSIIQVNSAEQEDKSLGGVGRLKPKEPEKKPADNDKK